MIYVILMIMMFVGVINLKVIYLLFAFVLLSSSVIAYDKDIETLAVLLNTSDVHRTVNLIDYVVENIIEYEYNSKSKGVARTWEDKSGDCTDKAELKQYMKYKVGIPARLVHGYLDGEKHDWVQYYYEGEWWSTDTVSEKVGNGIW